MSKTPLANILIVVDDSELLEVLTFVLEDGGYGVSVATTTAEALALSDATAFDLAVIDFSFDRMSGLDVARRLHAGSAAGRPRVALYCALDESVVRERCADYDLFMPKLDDADAFLKMIADALAGVKQVADAGADPVATT